MKITDTSLTIKDNEIINSELFAIWRGLDRDYERFNQYLKIRRELTPCNAAHLHHIFQRVWIKLTKKTGCFTGCLANVINYTNTMNCSIK